MLDKDSNKLQEGLVDGIFLENIYMDGEQPDVQEDKPDDAPQAAVSAPEDKVIDEKEVETPDVKDFETVKVEPTTTNEDTPKKEEESTEDVDDSVEALLKQIEEASNNSDKAVDESDRKIEKAKEELDSASTDEEKKEKLAELKSAIYEKDLLLEELKNNNEILMKRFREEATKRKQLELDTQDATDIFEKVTSNNALRVLVDTYANKGSDEEARKRYLDIISDLYEAETGEKISNLVRTQKNLEKEAISNSGGDVGEGNADSDIDESGLKGGIFLPGVS